MDQIELFLENRVWLVRDAQGVWPVTFDLKANGWALNALYSDGPARLSYEVVIESYGVKYIVCVDEDRNIEYVRKAGSTTEHHNRLVISTGHPAAGFFYKSNAEETIPITSSFDRQRY